MASERDEMARRLLTDIFDAVPDNNDMQHVLRMAAHYVITPAIVTTKQIHAAVDYINARRTPAAITDEMVTAGARALRHAFYPALDDDPISDTMWWGKALTMLEAAEAVRHG